MNGTDCVVISLSTDIYFNSVELEKVATDLVHQEEIIKAFHEGIGALQQSPTIKCNCFIAIHLPHPPLLKIL